MLALEKENESTEKFREQLGFKPKTWILIRQFCN